MGVVENVGKFLAKVFGTRNDRLIKSTFPIVEKINALEEKYEAFSDGELREETDRFKKRLKEGETLDQILPEAFALVREGSKRFLRMRHFDVQLMGGIFLHQGKIAEMVTGEGKTLVATLPAYLNALEGKGVHIVTVNDYLAKRDRDWNAPLFEGLGLSVGAIQSHMDSSERQREYACDITYGTNNEFGFDYLRDNMKMDIEDQVQRGLNYCIIDEVDSVLIDEARTPLIISGGAEESVDIYYKANRIAQALKKGRDYEVKEKERSIIMTEEGMERAEELAGVGPLYSGRNGLIWPHALDNALSAKELYKRDKDYMVEDGKVIIIDEFTGRKMEGRTWSDGLHQAIEAKEGLKIQEETQTLATITFQNYFRLYKKLSGMTGTAMTEAAEFAKIYDLDVVALPTNRPLIRHNFDDRIYGTLQEKFAAIEEEVVAVHASGRPVLVGTVSVENSELLSERIRRRGVPHQVLNAKYHEKEAAIVAKAGQLGAVTIATNMAGRGTDIVLGTFTKQELLDHWKKCNAAPKKLRLDDPEFYDKLQEFWKRGGLLERWKYAGIAKKFEVNGKVYEGMPLCTSVRELGGLHIVGTERHEARRIDNQLRGRCGRQGDPGTTRFFLSLEDDLMRIFANDWVRSFLQKHGMSGGQDISHPWVSKAIERAQKKVEAHHFEIRKHLLDYDKVMNEQRTIIYNERQAILRGENLKDKIKNWIREDIVQVVEKYAGEDVDDEQKDYNAIVAYVFMKYGILLDLDKYKTRKEEYKEPEVLAPYIIDIIEKHRYDQIQKQIHDYIQDKVGQDVTLTVAKKNQLRNWVNTTYDLGFEKEDLEHLSEKEDFIRVFQQRAEELDIHSLDEEEREKILDLVKKKFTNPKDPRKAMVDIQKWVEKKYGVHILEAGFYRRQPLYQGLAEGIIEEIFEKYEQREKSLGAENMRQLERFILLQKIDEKWKDHLRAMDELKASIGMRGYGQEDPKIAYKREGYRMFEEMNQSLKNEVTDLILKLVIEQDEEMHDVYGLDTAEAIHQEFLAHEAAMEAAAEASKGEETARRPIRAAVKVGRNDPCICGSGKKYKKCCGE